MTRAPGGGESRRTFLVTSGALFALSCLFPIAASLLQADRIPKLMGVADVVVAATVAVSGMLIMSKKPSGFAAPIVASSFKAYRALANAFLILLGLFLLVGDAVRWSILVPGLAWRGWLLAMVLPSWLSAWHGEQRTQAVE